MKGIFVTSTDTGVGKTYVSLQLLNNFNAQGLKTAALKPIASDCRKTSDGLRNADAELLMNNATLKFPYQHVNPFAFEPAVAPHIAASLAKQSLSVISVLQMCQPILQSAADIIVIEGIGGWLCPLNSTETLADLALAFNFPILLVVGIRLGCLNHALLTWESMQKRKAKVFGWIANLLEPQMLANEENIQYLEKTLASPFLGTVPYHGNFASLNNLINTH